MDGYSLSRAFWDYAFENPHKIKPNHCAIYFFAIEQCNRLGWKENFGLPTGMAMEATGIKSYSVYKETFDSLVEQGMFECLQYSKNQYTSNIIALKENYKAHNKAPIKALDKAILKQDQKQTESILGSTDSINKQETKQPQITEQETNKPLEFVFLNEVIIKKIEFNVFWDLYNKKVGYKKAVEKKWDSFNIEIQKKIIEVLPSFLATIKDKQFQPYPATFLNQERWTNEIEILKPKIDDNTTIIPVTEKGFSFSTSRCK